MHTTRPGLSVTVTLKKGATAASDSLMERIKTIVESFFNELEITGEWKAQIGCLEIRDIPMENGTLRVIGQSSLATQTQVCTLKGEKREVALTGPIDSSVLMSMAQKFRRKTFRMEDSKRTVITESETTVSADQRPTAVNKDDIAMLMMLFQQKRGSILKVDAELFCSGLSERLLEHCLESGLIVHDGTAAFTMTASGQDFLPAESVPEKNPVQSRSVDLNEIKGRIEKAKAVLAERKPIEEYISQLTQLVKSHNADHQREVREVQKYSQLVQQHQQRADARRQQALKAEASLKNEREKLDQPRFREAQEELDTLKRLIRELNDEVSV